MVKPSCRNSGSSWRITLSREMLKKGGASTHPCLNPTLVCTGAESTSLRMVTQWDVWRSLMRVTSFGGAPLLHKICQAISKPTESKALVRSSMQVCRVWPLSQAPLQRRRRRNRVSMVLLFGLKPHCSLRRLSASHSDRRALSTLAQAFPAMLWRTIVWSYCTERRLLGTGSRMSCLKS